MSVTETETVKLPLVYEGDLVQNWLRECGRADPIFLAAEGYVARGGWQQDKRNLNAGTLRITSAGHLEVEWRRPHETLELGRFIGERRGLGSNGGALLLNGDGLRAGEQQALQTRLRQRAQRVFNTSTVMIVPYRALASAGIVLDSIRPIHVSGETWETRRYPVPAIPNFRFNSHERDTRFDTITGLFTHSGVTFRLDGGNGRWRRGGWQQTFRLSAQVQPENGELGWWTVNRDWTVSTQVHRLGATVFTADTTDGNHKFISAFDEVDEGMYYLAQLPDDVEVTTYADALAALAPPIVHQARREGKEVYRQGDIFFVETNLSRAQVRDGASTVTRRSDVMNGDTPIPRNRRRRRLMIYGTGHTATIVAKMRNGAELVTGTAFHDPGLETRGRRREHRNITLGNKWFLCVRNTVPRQS